MKARQCPVCKRIYFEYPAISRKDNQTEICPACGVQEAIDAAIAFNRFKKAYYKGRPEAKHTVTLNSIESSL